MNWWDKTKNWVGNQFDNFKVGWNGLFNKSPNLTGGQKQQENAQNNTKGNIFDGVDWAKMQESLNAASGGGSKPKYVPTFNKSFNDYFNEDQAREKATNEYNPFYDKKVSDAVKKFDTQETRATEDYNYGKTVEENALNSFLEQTGLSKTRTTEDLRSEIARLAGEKGMTLSESAYDRIRQMRGLVSELAGSGLQFGGMAAQAGREERTGNKLMKTRVETTFKNQEDAANVQASRAIQDVDLSEKDRKRQSVETLGKDSKYWDEVTAGMDENTKAALTTGSLGRTKQRTLEDIQTNKSQELYDLDQERKYKIEQAVNSQWNKAYDLWDMDMKQYMAKYGISI